MAWLAGLLTGGLIVSGATPALARPEPALRGGTSLTARLAPPVVTVGEPAAVVAQLTPAQAGRPVTVVGSDGTELATATLDPAGRAVVPLDTSSASTQVLRVVAGAWNDRAEVRSRPVTLKVLDASYCVPKVPLVDKGATVPARCLVARLDRWKSAGLMGVGQQLNMSNDQYTAPLLALGERRVNVVGFDLWELGKTKTYEFPFYDRALADLIAIAQGGAVLTASWHAPNPHTGREYSDRSWHDLGALLKPDAPEAQAFWSDFAVQLEVLAELQAAGAAVVFRPFHEVNGDWFWWGRPDPTTFKRVWAEMQRRARDAGVNNVVWAYSFAAANRKGIAAPQRLLPKKVDLAGIDSYWPSTGSHRSQTPSMRGYAAVAKRVPRMAITEIGPSADIDGNWKASLVTSTARAQRNRPVWALLWVDDSGGKKQIASLDGGLSWLDSCPNAYCLIR
jgi:hypothetical protein